MVHFFFICTFLVKVLRSFLSPFPTEDGMVRTDMKDVFLHSRVLLQLLISLPQRGTASSILVVSFWAFGDWIQHFTWVPGGQERKLCMNFLITSYELLVLAVIQSVYVICPYLYFLEFFNLFLVKRICQVMPVLEKSLSKYTWVPITILTWSFLNLCAFSIPG